MPEISLKCSCGEEFTYQFDAENIKSELERMGVVPILVSHKDHFITVYIDENLTVRSIERVILVKGEKSSVIVKSAIDKDSITQIVNDIRRRRDPSKEFYSFLSLLITKVKEPENLFLAGRQIGLFLWNKRREPLIKLGASFLTDPKLLLNNEITPIYEKIAKVKKLSSDNRTIVIKESISPQFMIGLAQGIIDAIYNYMNKQGNIVLEYTMSGQTVFLTLKEVNI
jgi:hypothetical protein